MKKTQAAVLVCIAALAGPALAQTASTGSGRAYPVEPVRIVVPQAVTDALRAAQPER